MVMLYMLYMNAYIIYTSWIAFTSFVKFLISLDLLPAYALSTDQGETSVIYGVASNKFKTLL